MLRIGVLAVLIAVGVTACGSGSDTADTAAQQSSVTAAATVVPSSAAPSAAAPADTQLQQTLEQFVDPTTPVAEKVAAVVNGAQRTANIEAMTAALANYGRVTFVVRNIKADGRSAVADVDVTSPHGTVPVPMTWENVDGTWKLSDASTCALLAMGRAGC